MTADEIANAGWSCGSCGLEFTHDEGVHDVQYGIYHEFTCKTCYAAEQSKTVTYEQTPDGTVYRCTCGHVSRAFAELPAGSDARIADLEGAAAKSAASHLLSAHGIGEGWVARDGGVLHNG